MAINITDFQLPITFQHAHDVLQRSTDNFGVFFDLDRVYELQYIMYNGMLDVYKLMCSVVGKRFNINKKQEVIDMFISMGVPSQEFGDGTSLNREVYTNIMENMDYSDVVRAFANGYAEYQTYKTRYNTLSSYALNLYESELWSTDGHRLIVAHPTWKILSTSRLGASDPNVQGISRDYTDIVAEPEGYHLVRCDSSQIEPRINWSYYLRDELIMNLINCYNDAYLGILEYCQLTDEEELKLRQDFSHYVKKETTPEFKKKRQDIKRLTNAASYGSNKLAQSSNAFERNYYKKIVRHPKRIELEAKVREQVGRGDYTFYGAFHTPVTPDETQKYTKSSTGWEGHIIRCGINNPVQTTASELMLFSINEAIKVLSQAEDSHIAFYKHDEGCFYVSDKDKENGIIEQLSDITAYNVQGWLPIPAEPEYGRLKPSTFPTVLP